MDECVAHNINHDGNKIDGCTAHNIKHDGNKIMNDCLFISFDAALVACSRTSQIEDTTDRATAPEQKHDSLSLHQEEFMNYVEFG